MYRHRGTSHVLGFLTLFTVGSLLEWLDRRLQASPVLPVCLIYTMYFIQVDQCKVTSKYASFFFLRM